MSSYVGFEILTAVVMNFCPLRYNIVQFDENQPTFRKNMSPPSSGAGSPCHLLCAGFLLGLYFGSEDEGGMLIRNVGLHNSSMINDFVNRYSGGWSPIGSTRHCGHS
jgi:hypothetical protein